MRRVDILEEELLPQGAARPYRRHIEAAALALGIVLEMRHGGSSGVRYCFASPSGHALYMAENVHDAMAFLYEVQQFQKGGCNVEPHIDCVVDDRRVRDRVCDRSCVSTE